MPRAVTVSDVQAELVRRHITYEDIALLARYRHGTKAFKTSVYQAILMFWNRPDVSPRAGTINAQILPIVEECIYANKTMVAQLYAEIGVAREYSLARYDKSRQNATIKNKSAQEVAS